MIALRDLKAKRAITSSITETLPSEHSKTLALKIEYTEPDIVHLLRRFASIAVIVLARTF